MNISTTETIIPIKRNKSYNIHESIVAAENINNDNSCVNQNSLTNIQNSNSNYHCNT